MKLTDEIRGIEVFYDGRCGMCCSFHEWINRQPRAFGIGFIPYQAAEAERVFPGLGTLDPAREMVVRTSEGRFFRGAEAGGGCLVSGATLRAMGSPDAWVPPLAALLAVLASGRVQAVRGRLVPS